MGGREVTLQLPRGAADIVRAIDNGMRPAGPVLVVCAGEFDWDNAMVHVDPKAHYRWDWVEGLPSVVVLIGKDTRFRTLLRDIDAAGPGQLDVVDVEGRHAWMVLRTAPKLRTVAWHQGEVDDWLGDQQWHLQRARLLHAYGQEVV